jgi:hypothetical protein
MGCQFLGNVLHPFRSHPMARFWRSARVKGVQAIESSMFLTKHGESQDIPQELTAHKAKSLI